MATLLSDAIAALKEQAVATRARDSEKLNLQGFDGEMAVIYQRSSSLKDLQTATIATIAHLRDSLHAIGGVITNITSALIEQCGSWVHTVDESMTVVLQAKERLARQLYEWLKVQVVQPAMKRKLVAKDELAMAEAKLKYEEETMDPDNVADYNAANTDYIAKKAKDEVATEREAAGKSEFEAVLADVSYDQLRSTLSERGVPMGPDPRKVKPSTDGFKSWALRFAEGVLALGSA